MKNYQAQLLGTNLCQPEQQNHLNSPNFPAGGGGRSPIFILPIQTISKTYFRFSNFCGACDFSPSPDKLRRTTA